MFLFVTKCILEWFWLPEGAGSSASPQSPLCRLERASIAVPGREIKSFCLCAKIEAFAAAHGPDKSDSMLASTKLRIVSTKFTASACGLPGDSLHTLSACRRFSTRA